ncbi:hypothetical protein ABTN29_20780, partial [Acinetobacter baumannii]
GLKRANLKEKNTTRPEGAMQISKIMSPLSDDIDAPTQSMLGLAALAAELAAEGVSVKDLFARTGAQPSQLEDPHARIS